MDKLDLKDRKILYELDLNARQSDSEIARKVGLSKEVVRYRISRLQQEGYINYFITLLNSMKLGFMWFRTFFKFQRLNPKKEEEIISWLKKRATWVTKVEGPWDINTGIFCRNIYEFRDVMNEFMLKYGSYVEKHWISVITRMWHYHRGYLLDKKQELAKPDIMGYGPEEKHEAVEIGEMNYKILQKLLTNARMKNVDIARELGTTEIVVRYRIRKLIEKGIIIGFRPFLDIGKLGYRYFKVHIALQDIDTEKKRRLLNFVHQHPNIIYMTELVGGADLEIEFQVKSNDHLYACLKELREHFAGLIKDCEFMEYTKEYKFSYLPEMEFRL